MGWVFGGAGCILMALMGGLLTRTYSFQPARNQTAIFLSPEDGLEHAAVTLGGRVYDGVIGGGSRERAVAPLARSNRTN